MGLPGREKSLTIALAIWIQYTNVTDRRTDGQTPADSIVRRITHSVARQNPLTLAIQ